MNAPAPQIDQSDFNNRRWFWMIAGECFILGAFVGYLAPKLIGIAGPEIASEKTIQFLGKEWREDYDFLGGEAPVYTCEWDNVYLDVDFDQEGQVKAMQTFSLNPVTDEWISNGIAWFLDDDGSVQVIANHKNRELQNAFLPMQGFPLPLE